MTDIYPDEELGRENEKLKSEIANLTERLEAFREYREAMKQWDYLEGIRRSVVKELYRLKNLGEI